MLYYFQKCSSIFAAADYKAQGQDSSWKDWSTKAEPLISQTPMPDSPSEMHFTQAYLQQEQQNFSQPSWV